MKHKVKFLYPGIFVFDEDETCQVIFPDLNIYTQGKNMAEAYVYAQVLLKAYFEYAIKYETDFNKPSKVEDLAAKCKKGEMVMLVDATVDME